MDRDVPPGGRPQIDERTLGSMVSSLTFASSTERPAATSTTGLGLGGGFGPPAAHHRDGVAASWGAPPPGTMPAPAAAPAGFGAAPAGFGAPPAAGVLPPGLGGAALWGSDGGGAVAGGAQWRPMMAPAPAPPSATDRGLPHASRGPAVYGMHPGMRMMAPPGVQPSMGGLARGPGPQMYAASPATSHMAGGSVMPRSDPRARGVMGTAPATLAMSSAPSLISRSGHPHPPRAVLARPQRHIEPAPQPRRDPRSAAAAAVLPRPAAHAAAPSAAPAAPTVTAPVRTAISKTADKQCPTTTFTLSTRVCEPKNSISVKLEGPAPSATEEYIALFRSHQWDNSKDIVRKKIKRPGRVRPGSRYKRQVRFYAPRGHGNYEFRLFSVSDAKKSSDDAALAVSTPLRVEIQGSELPEALRFAYKQLDDYDITSTSIDKRDVHKLNLGLGNIRTLLIRARQFPKSKDAATTLWNAVRQSRRVALGVSALAKQLETVVAKAVTETAAAGGDGGGDDERGEDKEDEQPSPEEELLGAIVEREAPACHASARAVLDTVLDNPALRSRLSKERQRLARCWANCYCGVCDELLLLPTEPRVSKAKGKGDFSPEKVLRQVESVSADGALPRHVLRHIESEHGIAAGTMKPPARISTAVTDSISKGMMELARELIPGPDFGAQRMDLCRRLSAMLGGLPAGTSIQLFGSTVNGFGSKRSDCDMCLIQNPAVADSEPWNPADIVERAAPMLEAGGMLHVNPRATARIPIVMFEDPVSGLECDLCASNPLALRNTALLRTYAQIDPRVRPLAYALKNWASKRQINNPSGATLSSYGYLLLLFNHLMARPIPVLGCLTAMSPSWHTEQHEFPTVTPESMPVVDLPNAEQRMYNTYFYEPKDERSFGALRLAAARNEESLGKLFMSFYWRFLFEFDHRRNSVSIRAPAQEGRESRSSQALHFNGVSKDDKIDEHKWSPKPLLTIEDPFEHDYNVAHVLRPTTFRKIKLEMARAYSLLCQSKGDDAIARLRQVCEPAPEPAPVHRPSPVRRKSREPTSSGGDGAGGAGAS